MDDKSFKQYINNKINDNFTGYYIVRDNDYQYIGKNAIIKNNIVILYDVKIDKILELFKDFKPELQLNISDIQTFNNCYKELYDLY